MSTYTIGLVLLVLVTCGISCLAEVYTVGDKAGWSLSVDYSTWAAGKTFKVGDNLELAELARLAVFNYGSSHTVAEVSSDDYDKCNVANTITSYTSSPTTIALNKTGTHYFVCGVMGHCSGGMKVSVPVAGDGATPTPTGSDGSSSAKPTPTPSTTGKVPASSATISPVVASWLISLVSLVLMFVLA